MGPGALPDPPEGDLPSWEGQPQLLEVFQDHAFDVGLLTLPFDVDRDRPDLGKVSYPGLKPWVADLPVKGMYLPLKT